MNQSFKAPKLLAQPTAALYVDRFCRNNIDGCKFSYQHLLRYNLASVLTLHRQGRIPTARARRLAAALRELAQAGPDGIHLDPGLEDIQPNIERAVIERIGAEDGGDISLGRARFEFVYIGLYLAIREEVLAMRRSLLEAISALVDLAETHLETPASYYTHNIRAEPITFGYYFSSMAEALLTAAGRVQASYDRLSVSPAGVGQVVPTSFPLDRGYLAELLGLQQPVQHSLYGYWNVDALIDVLGSSALTGATMGRFASDLYWWSSSDLGLIKWGEEWTGGSFIMPQKRNPSWLKPVRQAAIDVASDHGKALHEYLNTAPMLLVGLIEVPGLTHHGVGELKYGLDLLAAALPTARIDKDRGLLHARSDYIQAAQIVHHLVQTQQASWRESELIVGQFVREAIALGKDSKALNAARLCAIARGSLNRDIAFTSEALSSCLDPMAVIRTRGDSGPAPDAVKVSIKTQREAIAIAMSEIALEANRISQTWRDLDHAAERI
jgi:argininosuccinate lyase